MIGKLKGMVETLDEDSLILDVGGVGYEIFASTRTLAVLAEGAPASLMIETHVREDHIHLYGFPDAVEKSWFRLLTTVQGVGVKMALAILGAFAPVQLAQSIAAGDVTGLTRVSGVGPKLASRLVVELKNKVAKLPVGGGMPPATVVTSPGRKGKKTPAPGAPVQADHGARAMLQEDAVSALVNLGYMRTDAFSAVARSLQKEPDAPLDALIRLGLKELA